MFSIPDSLFKCLQYMGIKNVYTFQTWMKGTYMYATGHYVGMRCISADIGVMIVI